MSTPDPPSRVLASDALAQPGVEPAGRSLWVDAWRTLKRNRAAVVGACVIGAMTLVVIIGPWLAPYAFDYVDFANASVGPSLAGNHFFGTDTLGRDLFARTLYGGRISLLVGVVSTAVSLVIGVAYGSAAGYLGGRLDALMMRFVDILYALPFMFFVILLMVFFGRHLVLIFVAIGAINWLDMARIVRGQTLSLKRREFVEAAEAQGVGTVAILRRHVVPNLLGIVAVYVTLTIPTVILVESFLSFLGLGVQEPMTSWGALVHDGSLVLESAPWMLLFPATFLAVTLFCFNFVGDGLRDALDPKDR
jgi:oligopeptide transport system permease protein